MYAFLKIIYLWLCFLIITTACNQSNSWSIDKSFENAQWQYADSLTFSYENQQVGTFPLRLKVNIKDDYAYRNLWLKLQIIAPDGKAQTALSEFLLMDESGNWYVDRSWFSQYRNFETKWGQGIALPQIGTYQIKIIQYMREDTLKGIRRVGLCIG
jgi:gliding motility-associated lipoprotein GldH